LRTQKRKIGLLVYRFFDWLTALIAWLLFFSYRKRVEEPGVSWETIIQDPQLLIGLAIIPIGWLILYNVFDKYSDIYRYSRLATFSRTFFISLLGSLLIFFTIMRDDSVMHFTSYVNPFVKLLGLHFGLTALGRMVLLTLAHRRLRSGKIAFNTILIGGDKNALDLYEDIKGQENQWGHRFIGFIDSNGNSQNLLAKHLPILGSLEDISEIIKENEVEEVIVAIETSEHDKLKSILNVLFDFDHQVLVKIIPDMYDIMLGTVKMNHVYGAALIEIDQEIMPKWERIFKRIMDLGLSFLALLLFWWVFVLCWIRVKLSSKGPVFHRQERVGKGGVPFNILKFRSMYIDAESSGPQLTKDNDPRVTSWGKVMRKYRMDELPNIFNVIKGEMSLVGPRPERAYYIEQIVKQAPHYKHLLKVRPGITSWGQVKYGYASDISEMVQRLKFDMIYLENMSIALDIKIMIYTIMVIFKGKGK